MSKGSIVKFLRKGKNLSQEELADMIGVNVGAIIKIETGRRPMRDSECESISKALGVSLESLKSK